MGLLQPAIKVNEAQCFTGTSNPLLCGECFKEARKATSLAALSGAKDMPKRTLQKSGHTTVGEWEVQDDGEDTFDPCSLGFPSHRE